MLSTREEIAEAYAFIRGMSDLHEVSGLTEITGSWYLFQDAFTVGSPKDTDIRNYRHTLALVPIRSGARHHRRARVAAGTPVATGLSSATDVEVLEADDLHARRLVLGSYQQYLEGLRANDVDAVLGPLHDNVASAIRDYVDETGTLVEPTGKEAHRTWYSQLLAKYEVRSALTDPARDHRVVRVQRIAYPGRTA